MKDIPSEPCGARCDPKSYVAGDTQECAKDKRRVDDRTDG